MIKYLIMAVASASLIFLTIKIWSFLESKIKETYGWKIDVGFTTAICLTVAFGIIFLYAVAKVFLYVFIY